MKIWYILLLFIVYNLGQKAMAQTDTITICGKVLFGEEPAEACIVSLLHPVDSTIVDYSMTDEQGNYCMRFISRVDEVLIRVDGFNVKRQVKRIAARTQTVDFIVEEEALVLKEIMVEAQKLWGNRDTLNYLVSAYIKEHDRTIGDVLRQLPGITIDDNGTIKYQGTPINHFYIENLDMLQGRYGLATEGIKANDVLTVQVLEHHEHIKALQDQMPPESAAINLKLKDKAKGMWSKKIDGGIGVYGKGMLWNVTASAMQFDKKGQHLLRYSGDNYGRNSYAAVNHYGITAGSENSLVGVIGHGTSSVGNSYFGYSHEVNCNNIAKFANGATFNYNINYQHNYSKGESYASTAYILPDGSNILLTEDIADNNHTDAVDLQLIYEKNEKMSFLNNTLTMSGKWNEARGWIQSLNNISQALHYRSLGLKNRTKWVHRTQNGGGFQLTTTNSVSTSPQKLVIGEDMDAMQEVNIMRVATRNTFETLNNLSIHRWSLSVLGHLNSNYTTTSSTLHHPDTHISPLGDMQHIYTQADVGLSLRYARINFRANLDLPMAMTHTWLNNARVEGEKTNAQRICFRITPGFSLNWKANDYFSVNVGAYYGSSESPWRQLMTASIMQNYRSVSRYRAHLNDTYSSSANFKVAFKDIFKGIFAYVSGSWNRSWSDVALGTTYDEQGRAVIETSEMPNHNQSYSITVNGRKDIDWHDIQLELSATARRGESDLLRQSVFSSYHTKGYNVSGNLSFDIVEGYRFEYNANWNRLKSSSDNYQYSYSYWDQAAMLNLRLIKSRLYFNVSARHTHNDSFSSNKKDYVFVGAGLLLKTSGKMEFNLKAENITNLRKFVSFSADEMRQSNIIYHLRPWSVMLTTNITL